jgi:hypothetical protein
MTSVSIPTVVVREPLEGEAFALRHVSHPALPSGGLALVDGAGSLVAADRLGTVLGVWLNRYGVHQVYWEDAALVVSELEVALKNGG